MNKIFDLCVKVISYLSASRAPPLEPMIIPIITEEVVNGLLQAESQTILN